MVLADYKELVSNAAIFITSASFLAGGVVCKKFIANKSTAEASCFPFTCGFLSASMWLLYGFLKEDDLIILTNIFGVIFPLIYMAIFYFYTLKKHVVVKQFVVTVLFIFVMMGYMNYESNTVEVIENLGLLSCGLGLLFIAAPATKTFYVIKVKNTECLPFPMIVMSFAVCLIWLIYGIIVQDPFLQLPNFLGCVMAGAQLMLFLIFPSSPKANGYSKVPLIT